MFAYSKWLLTVPEDTARLRAMSTRAPTNATPTNANTSTFCSEENLFLVEYQQSLRHTYTCYFVVYCTYIHVYVYNMLFYHLIVRFKKWQLTELLLKHMSQLLAPVSMLLGS